MEPTRAQGTAVMETEAQKEADYELKKLVDDTSVAEFMELAITPTLVKFWQLVSIVSETLKPTDVDELKKHLEGNSAILAKYRELAGNRTIAAFRHLVSIVTEPLRLGGEALRAVRPQIADKWGTCCCTGPDGTVVCHDTCRSCCKSCLFYPTTIDCTNSCTG